jgi:hypothetical protein
LLRVSALVGAVAVIAGAYNFFLAPPSVSVTIKNETINASVSSPFDMPLLLTNTSRFGAPQVWTKTVHFSESDSSFDESGRVITLNGGQSQDLTIRGRINRPGDAHATIELLAKGGYFWPARLRTATMTISVWKPLERGSFVAVASACQASTCLFQADLLVGTASAGLECWARTVGEPGFDFRGVPSEVNGGERSQRSNTAGPETVLVQWRTAALGGFTRHRVQLAVTAPSRTLEEWNRLGTRIDWECNSG